MTKKILLLFSFMICSLSAETWHVLVYMDSDELSDMAIKNISDMLQAGTDDNVQFYVQLHAYDRVGLRYKVVKNNLCAVEQIELSGNVKYDLIDAATWAFGNHASDHTMLVLWNHGWGILDPVFNEATEQWEASAQPLSNVCVLKRYLPQIQNPAMVRRGFIFSKEPRAYLNNQDMIAALDTIKETILQGKSLDIVAFDTCMGGMLEVGYQIAPFAHYLVGNQSCSLRDGFNYDGILTALHAGPEPRDMVKSMVQVFDDYYAQNDRSGVYTHTALDLSYVAQASKAGDAIIQMLVEEPTYLPYIMKAYQERPQFCLFPMYSDFVAFVKNIEKQISNSSDESMTNLKTAIEQFYAEVSSLVVARCGGLTTNGKAYGFSVYMPAPGEGIDQSYPKTMFAQDTHWLKLLALVQSNAHAQ